MPQSKEQKAAYDKEYYIKNKEAICDRVKLYQEKNKEKIAAQRKEYREKNKEKLAARRKEYREKNKEKIADINKKWRTNLKNKQYLTEYNRMVKYGITPDSFKRMLKEQNNKCKICLVEFDELKPNQKINVDHCHTSNQVRGLLCSLCNRGLGHFKDNTERLTNAINYLQENK